MQRRILIAGLLLWVAGPWPALARTPPAERQRQREKEATDRAVEAPHEARRARTQEQFKRRNRQNDRRRGIPPPPF